MQVPPLMHAITLNRPVWTDAENVKPRPHNATARRDELISRPRDPALFMRLHPEHNITSVYSNHGKVVRVPRVVSGKRGRLYHTQTFGHSLRTRIPGVYGTRSCPRKRREYAPWCASASKVVLNCASTLQPHTSGDLRTIQSSYNFN